MATLKRLKRGRFPVPLVDTVDTELERKEQEAIQFVDLYDPPVNGATPLDGEGKPMTSPIQLRDKAAKLGQGFTKEPVGAEGPTATDPKPRKVAPQLSRKDALAANADRAAKSKTGMVGS